MSTSTKKGGEKLLLGPSTKSYGRSYGSTKKSTQDIFIKHVILPDDTLAGIALKYAISVEQIKRANKLYTNDSIFLRTTLSIPVGDQPLPAHVLENATARATGSPVHKVAGEPALFDSSEEEDPDEGRGEETAPDDVRDVQMDFFNRIDRQLQEGRHHIAKIETNSSITDIEAISPNVQGSPSKNASPGRQSPTSGHSTNRSYQMGSVTVNTNDASRRGGAICEVTGAGASKDMSSGLETEFR